MSSFKPICLIVIALCLAYSQVDTYVDIQNEDEYYAITGKEDKTVLVYFQGIWCNPCKPFDQDFDQLKLQYPDTPFYRVDVDKFRPQFFHDIQMYQVPTVYLYVNGQLSDQFYGHTQENVQKLQQFAAEASEYSEVEVD